MKPFYQLTEFFVLESGFFFFPSMHQCYFLDILSVNHDLLKKKENQLTLEIKFGIKKKIISFLGPAGCYY